MPGPTPQYATNAARQRAYRQRCQVARLRERTAKGLPPQPAIATLPGAVRWRAQIEAAAWHLETAAAEMEEYYQNRTEGWQDSERGATFRERLEAVQEACSTVADLRDR